MAAAARPHPYCTANIPLGQIVVLSWLRLDRAAAWALVAAHDSLLEPGDNPPWVGTKDKLRSDRLQLLAAMKVMGWVD